jgi:hypothetical protein
MLETKGKKGGKFPSGRKEKRKSLHERLLVTRRRSPIAVHATADGTARKINTPLSVHPREPEQEAWAWKAINPQREGKQKPSMENKQDERQSRPGRKQKGERASQATPLLLLAPASGQQTHGEDHLTSKKELMEKRTSRTHTEKEGGRQSIHCSELLTTELTSRLG